MGKQINLLTSLPRVIRDPKLLKERRIAKSWDEHIYTSCLYGKDYFDGPRRLGYGGYYYDGRWIQVAKDIIKHYDLHQGAKVLDIGCAKGYLVYDLLNQEMEAYGIDRSRYAVQHCPTDIVGRIHCGDICDLPFPNDSFDLVLSINCIHNIKPQYIYLAFNEINRVAKENIFITVDSYRNKEEEDTFNSWVLTAKTHGRPEFWLDLFEQNNYNGDYDWCIWTSGAEDE